MSEPTRAELIARIDHFSVGTGFDHLVDLLRDVRAFLVSQQDMPKHCVDCRHCQLQRQMAESMRLINELYEHRSPDGDGQRMCDALIQAHGDNLTPTGKDRLQEPSGRSVGVVIEPQGDERLHGNHLSKSAAGSEPADAHSVRVTLSRTGQQVSLRPLLPKKCDCERWRLQQRTRITATTWKRESSRATPATP